MTCPYLAYRESGDGRTFEVARAYCTASDSFVQPMRADICNDRYDLDHAADCEIYREQEVEAVDKPTDSGSEDSDDGDSA